MEKRENTPQVRFEGYTDAWEKRKLGEVLIERNIQHPKNDDFPLVSFTVEEGVTPKTERYEREQLVVGDKNAKKYKETRLNDIVYNPANLKFGAIARNKYGNAVFSPIYVTFEVEDHSVTPEFVEMVVTRKDFIKAALKYQQGTVYERMSVGVDDFKDIESYFPNLQEQKAVGSFFETLDHFITLHQSKYKKLQLIKTALLDLMYPQVGYDTPQVRFEGYTDAWEQRKLGDLYSEGWSGGTPSATKNTYYNGTIPFLSISDLKRREISDTEKHITPEAINSSAAKLKPAGYLTLAMYASVGKTAIVNVDSATSQAFWNMKFDSNITRDFIFTRLQKADATNEWEPLISTGTQQNLNAKKVANWKLSVPHVKEQQQIGAFFKQIDNAITLHQSKYEKLQLIKTALLGLMFPTDKVGNPKEGQEN